MDEYDANSYLDDLDKVILFAYVDEVQACKLYESCGFELRGFDTHLYKAFDPATDEMALYWYLIF